MKLHDLTFVGGPACGRTVRVANVLEEYEHHHNGEVHVYGVVPSKRRGWGWAALHAGVLEVR